MKYLTLLGLAAAASAFVIPDQETLNSLAIEPQEEEAHPFWDNVPCAHRIWEDIEKKFDEATTSAKEYFDEAVDVTYDTAVEYGEKFESAFAGQSWLDSANNQDDEEEEDRPPHHGPPHKRPPHHGPPKHRRPHHPPHHGPPNQTVYQLIAESKYTTKLAAAVDEFPDLVKLLNGTSANFTVFAPTDRAFEKIPKHAPKPPKEFLKKLLTYHVSPEFYPAGRVLVTRTIPSALENPKFGGKPQRLATEIGLRGLTVNFYSRIVAIDIFGTNGVIHGIDSILLPPPKVAKIIEVLPGEFSTLELALVKTGLFEKFNDTDSHEGGTLFAPSNFAFQRLGARVNAFLFSKYGEKYLKALLLYHTVPDVVLYSDAIYKTHKKDSEESDMMGGPHHGPPKGFFHVDLPTGLKGKSLSIDVARYGRLIEIKINGFNRVAVSDGVAYDGVIHVVSSVLIPPKTPGAAAVAEDDMDLDDFLERMAPLVGDLEVDVNDLEL